MNKNRCFFLDHDPDMTVSSIMTWLKFFGPVLFAYPVRYKNKLQKSWVRILVKAIVFFLSLAANKAAEQAQKKAGTATAGAVGY